MSLLRVDKVRKEFDGVLAVDDVSFSLEKGTITGLIGPNGAGKTTILNLLNRLCQPDGGQISFNGHELTSLPPYRIAQLGIGRTFQNIRIFPQISVLENLMLAPRNQKGESIFSALIRTQQVKTDEREAREKALSYLGTVGLLDNKKEISESLAKVFNLFPRLKEKQHQRAGTLSSGEQQMLAIGRALMLEPKLLLVDEPSVGLSPNYVQLVFGKLKEINQNGTAILLVEQNAQTALQYSDRAYVFEIGKIALEGQSKDLFENEKVRNSFLGG
ncbi:High-affinity branched-chain amino acid transport ATP-binding protein LivF [subsurface metagenome]